MSSSTVTYRHMIDPRIVSERPSHRAFFGVSALLFGGSAALTIRWCGSMSAMGGMPMAGGWTMSMAWMRMPGQTLAGAATWFVLMWIVMMVAMMLPSLLPVLWRYREAVGRRGEGSVDLPTALVSAGYFAVWAGVGIAVFAVGEALARVEMQYASLSRAVPVATGVIVLIVGVLQFSAWKAHQLACCQEVLRRDEMQTAGARMAWRHGLRLGLHCFCDCAGWTAMLLVIGVMDLRAMALVTAAISVERLAPEGERVARALGAVVVAAGVLMIAFAVVAG